MDWSLRRRPSETWASSHQWGKSIHLSVRSTTVKKSNADKNTPNPWITTPYFVYLYQLSYSEGLWWVREWITDIWLAPIEMSLPTTVMVFFHTFIKNQQVWQWFDTITMICWLLDCWCKNSFVVEMNGIRKKKRFLRLKTIMSKRQWIAQCIL